MTRRRGHSLIEMLVIMSAASAVLTISAVLIHRTMRLASQTRAFHAEEATAWRLSGLLRSDAASAASIDLSLADEKVSVTFRGAEDDPIVYRFSGPHVERTQRLGGNSEARESFELPSVANWTAESLEQAAAVRIVATPSTLPTRSPAPVPVSLLVHAAGESLQ
jgi:hypothetical protein